MCLSPRVAMDRRQKLINPFVSETKEPACICLCTCITVVIGVAIQHICEISMYWDEDHHHHHIALVARISLILSRHSSLSFIALGRSSGQHPVSTHSCWMYVRAGRPAFARPCVGVHKSTSLMSSSLLLQ